jgi:hypothetical protein
MALPDGCRNASHGSGPTPRGADRCLTVTARAGYQPSLQDLHRAGGVSQEVSAAPRMGLGLRRCLTRHIIASPGATVAVAAESRLVPP